MMKKMFAAAAAALFTVGSFAGTADAQTQPSGVWRNPANSVHVRIQPCGGNICGTVVWANARAQQKARAAGTANLVGAQLFREFRRAGNAWGGRVFVPDRGRTVSGTLRTRDSNSLIASGCLMALVCRSQVWTRVS